MFTVNDKFKINMKVLHGKGLNQCQKLGLDLSIQFDLFWVQRSTGPFCPFSSLNQLNTSWKQLSNVWEPDRISERRHGHDTPSAPKPQVLLHARAELLLLLPPCVPLHVVDARAAPLMARGGVGLMMTMLMEPQTTCFFSCKQRSCSPRSWNYSHSFQL